MNERKMQLKAENVKYMEDHPEMHQILSDFMNAVLHDKPSDVYAFAADHFSAVERKALGHRPIVIAGPSGVGKSTLISMLLKEFPDAFGFCVSHTTRPPREGELDGREYFFVAEEAFRRGVEAGDFIECAEVHGQLYGTSIMSVQEVIARGKVCVLDIDVQGVANVKKTNLQPVYIFVTPPSLEELEARLRERLGAQEAQQEEMMKRMNAAMEEIEYGEAEGNFHILLVNDDLDVCYNNLRRCLVEWFPHLRGFSAPLPETEGKR